MKRPEHYWMFVLCLLGLDYFSTLAYQPSITYAVAGRLGPLATVLIVVLTLFGVVPVYCYLAGRSPTGSGSIGMIERVVRGWRGKTLVLMLLGFAATDFVMLKTLSLADAAVHVLGNQDTAWQQSLSTLAEHVKEWSLHWFGPSSARFVDRQLVTTLVLGFVGFVFWYLLRKGFNRNVLILAVPLVLGFLACAGFLLTVGVLHLVEHPEIVETWWQRVQTGDWDARVPGWLAPGFESLVGWGSIVVLSVLFLPKLALGLSGFEMGMIVMPQVRGNRGENQHAPEGRIRNTRKVLIVAGLVMSVYLLASSLVCTLLIPPVEMLRGSAEHRALSYLAHGSPLATGEGGLHPWCGPWFGSIFDVITILVLALAGTSVMTALASLIPQFLLRFGMELRWAHKWGVLLITFAAINLLVTVYFRADVDSQRGAYSTSVLMLMTCAGIVSAKDVRHHRGRTLSWLYFSVVALILALMTFGVAVSAPSSLVIAAGFIVAILALSVTSRALRADEQRTTGFTFQDEHSKFLWDTLKTLNFPVLVPHRPGQLARAEKERLIRHDHHLNPETEVVFLEAEVDDASNFYQTLKIEVIQEENRFVIRATDCASVSHAIAAIAMEMSKESDPPGLHFGWSELDLLTASWNYFAFGEGNIPWKVRELLRRLEPNKERRPRVIIG